MTASFEPTTPPAMFDMQGLDTALDHMSKGLAVLDPGDRVLYANRAFAALAGTGAGEVFAAADKARLHLGGRVIALEARLLPDGGRVVVADDVSAFAEAEARALDQARRDPLTGLANRTALREDMAAAFAALGAGGSGLAVLCLDLDQFKTINDTLGHPVGDALLRKVAERAASALGPDDILARLGGDEFAIVQFAGDLPDAAERLAARLVDLIGRSYAIDGHILNIGVSVGVALAPQDAGDADTLLKHADLALYRAKAGGRGTFRFFAPEMDAEMQARRALELDLRKALAFKEFELHYQPQLNLSANTITGFEALVRWRNPRRGLVSPGAFIPLAEEIGLIVPLGDWVIRTACHAAASWCEPMSIAVNVSPVQFASGRLVETVVSALARSGLEPQRLELEITESVLLQDEEATLRTLHALRGMGVKVSMDDFGTGYSSLSYLRRFPFDKIKIDQSFVRGETDAREGAAIVRAVAALGRSLGIATMAEGVETADQLDRIRADGCTDIQGYLISRPVPADAVAALIAGRAGPFAGPGDVEETGDRP